jgi:geranylgeranylglycerol-phosphate geranylgeranyltransferase
LNLRASISILRPVNCAMIGFAVIIGYFVSKPTAVSPTAMALGFVTGFAICAFSMVVNDYYDIEVDRVNQPTRPLPSGEVSKNEAVGIAVLMLVVGFAATALLLSLEAVLIVALYSFLAWLYDFRAKKYGLAGNLVVASSLAIPFIYGGVISGGQVLESLLLFMASTSFLAGVGREVVKAMADVPGDQKRGVRSYASVHGLRSAAGLGAVFFLLAVVTSVLPLLLVPVSVFYKVGVVVPDAAFVYLAYRIVTHADVKGALSVKKTALMGMLVGLIVFIGGAF